MGVVVNNIRSWFHCGVLGEVCWGWECNLVWRGLYVQVDYQHCFKPRVTDDHSTLMVARRASMDNPEPGTSSRHQPVWKYTVEHIIFFSPPSFWFIPMYAAEKKKTYRKQS